MNLSREFKIGFISLVALAMLIWGINYLKGINIFKKSSKYYAAYNDIGGLIESAMIYLNGYKVGNVTGISMDPENPDLILIEFSMDGRIRIPENSSAVIRSSSLISGVKDIYLEMGSGSGFYEPGDTLLSGIEGDMFEFIDPLVDKIESVVAELEALLNEEMRTELQGTISELHGTMASLKNSIQPGGSLAASLDNFESVSENLRLNNEHITNTLSNLSAVTDSLKEADLKSLIAHVDQTFTQTAQLFEQIQSGEGTAGKLIMSDSVYMNLNRSLADLDALLIDLKENPGRYVQVSVFGKRDQ